MGKTDELKLDGRAKDSSENQPPKLRSPKLTP